MWTVLELSYTYKNKAVTIAEVKCSAAGRERWKTLGCWGRLELLEVGLELLVILGKKSYSLTA